MSERRFSAENQLDGATVVGTLRGELATTMALFVPGFGGRINDMLPYNFVRHLQAFGISSIRMALYGNEERQRDITSFDAKTAGSDIDTVVSALRDEGVEQTFVIGHSYGALSILLSSKKAFNKAVLWDPSHTDGYLRHGAKKYISDDTVFVPEIDAYVSGKGTGHIYPKRIFGATVFNSSEIAKSFTVESLIVSSSLDPAMSQYGSQYAADIPARTNHVTIPDASHTFTEDGVSERLFGITTDWLVGNPVN